MNNYYGDIIEKLGEPEWFDDLGYPRYCKFDPNEISNIYAKEVALLEIACQYCGHRFKVAINHSGYNRYTHEKLSWMDDDNYKRLGYSDPPNIGCCSVGLSMSSDSIRILEFWTYDRDSFKMVRKPEFEVILEELEMVKIDPEEDEYHEYNDPDCLVL